MVVEWPVVRKRSSIEVLRRRVVIGESGEVVRRGRWTESWVAFERSLYFADDRRS